MVFILYCALSTGAVSAQVLRSDPARRFFDFPSQADLAISLRNETAMDLAPQHHLSKSQSIANVDIILPLGKFFWVTNRMRAIYDPVNKLEQKKQFDADPIDRWETRRRFEIDLREAYVDIGLGLMDLRLGRQQVVWGEADGIRVLDVVNPMEYREFILADYVDARIPLWMARGHIYAGEYTFDIVWIPDYEPARLAQPETEFTSRSHLGPGYKAPTAGALKPEDLIDEPEYGFRMIRTYGGAEFTLNFFDFYEDFATQDEILNPESQELETLWIYRRSRMYGGKFLNRISRTDYRAEFTLVHNRSVPAPDAPNGLLRRNILTMMVGVDYNAQERWSFADYGTFQYIHELILDHNDRMNIDKISHTVSLGLRRDLFRGILVAQAFALVNINNRDIMFRPRVSSDLHDNIRMSVSLDVFAGPRNGYYGQFGAGDRILATLEFHR